MAVPEIVSQSGTVGWVDDALVSIDFPTEATSTDSMILVIFGTLEPSLAEGWNETAVSYSSYPARIISMYRAVAGDVISDTIEITNSEELPISVVCFCVRDNTPAEFPPENANYAFADVSSVIPAMTTNTEPGGTASANEGNAVAFQAFDREPLTEWLGTATVPSSIQYDMGNGVSSGISRYSVTRTAEEDFPTSWVFQGSADGILWDDLDTQTLFTDYVSDVATFDISYVEYRFFRLQITAVTNGGACRVTELQVYYVASAGNTLTLNPYTDTDSDNLLIVAILSDSGSGFPACTLTPSEPTFTNEYRSDSESLYAAVLTAPFHDSGFESSMDVGSTDGTITACAWTALQQIVLAPLFPNVYIWDGTNWVPAVT